MWLSGYPSALRSAARGEKALSKCARDEQHRAHLISIDLFIPQARANTRYL